MGKFDGILIATDLDGTLLNSSSKVSRENIEAINYFMAEGGYFTFSSGRSKNGIQSVLKFVTPNVPIIIYNGTALYDAAKDTVISECFLDEAAAEVVAMIEDSFPDSGIVVCGQTNAYTTRSNAITVGHFMLEGYPENILHYSKINEPWRKVLFLQERHHLDAIKSALSGSRFAEKYTFVQSASRYYELLPKGITKAYGLKLLAELCGIRLERTVAIGDSENDEDIIKAAGLGIAVANASKSLKALADYITVDNDSHAIATVIDDIDKKIIKI